MGFGSGYRSRMDRGGKRYSNDMVAHVWNAQSEEAGQSGNGNFYFRGAALYSYGSHFVVGFIMPDGLAILNADSYSVSTSGHRSQARGAIRNRRRVTVAGLTDLAGDWNLLPRLASYLKNVGTQTAEMRRETQAMVRRELAAHAVALESPILSPGEWGHDSWDYETTPATRIPFDRSGCQEAGAYLAALVGLPATTWPRIKREAAAKRKAEARQKAKAERDAAEKQALRLSDMSAREWREYLAGLGTQYSSEGFKSLATELRRARKLMLAAKSGKLATAGRLATIRARLKHAEAERETFDSKRQPRINRQRLSIALAKLRDYRDATPEGKAALSVYSLIDLRRAAEIVGDIGRRAGLKASAIRLAAEADSRMVDLREEEMRAREKERAERVRLWLAGERVGAVRFDAESGGAALRIVGDVLETSHGAEVPLAHAVKVFRFVKLMRERGETWRRNGRTIRVGHFQVDSISSSGDFVAGCHNFTWPEVERVAKLAGVFDCPASADAVESSHVAALARAYRYWRASGRAISAATAMKLARTDLAKSMNRQSPPPFRDTLASYQNQPGERGGRWIENPAGAGLRFVGWADELTRASHGGYFLYPDGDPGETARGCVYQLPTPADGRPIYVEALRTGESGHRGADWTDMGEDGSAYVFLFESHRGEAGGYQFDADSDTAVCDAARGADREAELYAEREREYQEAFQAGSRFDILMADAEAERDAAREVMKELRVFLAMGRDIPAKMSATLRTGIRAHLANAMKAKAEARELREEWATLTGWRAHLANAFAEGAGDVA